MKRENWLFIILIVVIIILLQQNCSRIAQIREQDGLLRSMADTLQISYNKQGQQVAKIALLETERIRDFLALKTKDEEILRLQEKVKENKNRLGKSGSVTVVTNTTSVTGGDTTTVIMRDTVYSNDTVWIYPEYTSKINLGKRTDTSWWVMTSVKANRDSTDIGISVENAYTVVIGSEKKSKGFKGLFKPKIPFVEITNENPYTATKTLRSYQVKVPKPKRFGIGINAGYGIILDKKPVLRPYIGVGIQYNIVEFF